MTMPRLPAAAVLWIMGASILAGCASPESHVTTQDGAGKAEPPGVVLAIIDSGINPYHEAFQPGDRREVPQVLPEWADGGRIDLSTSGSYSARRQSDALTWASLERGRVYALGETGIYGVSFLDGSRDDRTAILDYTGHGTNVASLALRDAPQLTILVVQVELVMCLDGSCIADPSIARAMEWVAQQPWIDVISISIGIPGNMYDPPQLHPEAAAYVKATRAAAESGKLVVSAAGNEPTVGVTDYVDGPPWIIAVGGADARTGGDTAVSSRLVDVVANFTELVASENSTKEYYWDQGTSLGTPIVAATLADALLRLRQQLQPDGVARTPGALAAGEVAGKHVEITANDLRRALNVTARYFATQEWSPLGGGTGDPVRDLIQGGVPVVVPAQQGWGHVQVDVAGELAQAALIGGDAAKPLAAPAQAEWQRARELFWA